MFIRLNFLALSKKKMKPNHDAISALLLYVLPQELVDHFSIIDVREEEDTASLHIYLDEFNSVPVEYSGIDLSPNGFYPESLIKDFPLRDRKVLLHIRRRRWVDRQGRSYSSSWELTAEGTRYSKEFASFLKGLFGYDAHSGSDS